MRDVEPTEDEKKAGWTKEKLNTYIAEREREAAKLIFPTSKPLPREQVSYRPHRWRG